MDNGLRTVSLITNDEIQTADRRGHASARRVVALYRTTDVFEIAERAGVRVVYERWPLVTVGECEPRLRVVRINLAALDRAGKGNNAECSRRMLTSVILAHELGHFFNARRCVTGKRKRFEHLIGERVAHAFAASVLNLSRSCVEDKEL